MIKIKTYLKLVGALIPLLCFANAAFADGTIPVLLEVKNSSSAHINLTCKQAGPFTQMNQEWSLKVPPARLGGNFINPIGGTSPSTGNTIRTPSITGKTIHPSKKMLSTLSCAINGQTIMQGRQVAYFPYIKNDKVIFKIKEENASGKAEVVIPHTVVGITIKAITMILQL